MNLQIARFVRKPLYVNAVQVTEENMAEITKWCKGQHVHGVSEQYVKVRVHRATDERQKRAYVGDWVLKFGTGFKVYQHDPFIRDFEQVTGIEHNLDLQEACA
jgi:oligoribonuclease (3'-5' exoribonuclease)